MLIGGTASPNKDTEPLNTVREFYYKNMSNFHLHKHIFRFNH